MQQIIFQLVDHETVPACCIDKTGMILHANSAALDISPLCTTMYLSEFLPDFFPADGFQPDYEQFASQQTLLDGSGNRLELCRFGDWFLCRIQPAVESKNGAAPYTDGTAEVARIRQAAVNLLQHNSSAEDQLYDMYEDFERKQAVSLCKTMTGSLHTGSMDARRIILGCNRLEISYLGSFFLYPPQRIDLGDALMTLVSDIRERLPGLKMTVETEIDPLPMSVSINWELFRRALLEAFRMAAVSAEHRNGTTVFGVMLTREKKSAVITLSENTYLLPAKDDLPPEKVSREESMLFIRRVVEYFHGEVTTGETSTGDDQMQIRLPILPFERNTAPTLMVHNRTKYNYTTRVMTSDVLVYLESFTEPED